MGITLFNPSMFHFVNGAKWTYLFLFTLFDNIFTRSFCLGFVSSLRPCSFRYSNPTEHWTSPTLPSAIGREPVRSKWFGHIMIYLLNHKYLNHLNDKYWPQRYWIRPQMWGNPASARSNHPVVFGNQVLQWKIDSCILLWSHDTPVHWMLLDHNHMTSNHLHWLLICYSLLSAKIRRNIINYSKVGNLTLRKT